MNVSTELLDSKTWIRDWQVCSQFWAFRENLEGGGLEHFELFLCHFPFVFPIGISAWHYRRANISNMNLRSSQAYFCTKKHWPYFVPNFRSVLYQKNNARTFPRGPRNTVYGSTGPENFTTPLNEIQTFENLYKLPAVPKTKNGSKYFKRPPWASKLVSSTTQFLGMAFSQIGVFIRSSKVSCWGNSHWAIYRNKTGFQ